MKKEDQHYRLYRYLRSPIVDAGEGPCVSIGGLKVTPEQLSWFKERTLKSVCLDLIGEKTATALFPLLADGGMLVSPEITDDALKTIRKQYRCQTVKADPFTIVKRLSGPAGEYAPLVQRSVNGRKKILIIRYGALGDHLMVSTLIQHYHDEGWHVTYQVTDNGETIYKDDPRIDDLMVLQINTIGTNRKVLDDYWKSLGKEYDKTVSLIECVEGDLLRIEGTPEYKDSWEKRHIDCNKNYIDHHFTRAGLDIKGRLPSVWLSDKEREWAKSEVEMVRRKLGKKFIVLWNIFGSSWHKAYPWMFDVFWLIRNNRDDIGVLAISDYLGKYVLGNEYNAVVYNGCDRYKFRQSLALHSAVDAVVTPETWSLTAAQSFPAPMVALLSHSTKDNFTIREQDTYLEPSLKDAPCKGCHQLHYSRNGCSRGVLNTDATLCMDSIEPGTVYKELMKLRSAHGDDP